MSNTLLNDLRKTGHQALQLNKDPFLLVLGLTCSFPPNSQTSWIKITSYCSGNLRIRPGWQVEPLDHQVIGRVFYFKPYIKNNPKFILALNGPQGQKSSQKMEKKKMTTHNTTDFLHVICCIGHFTGTPFLITLQLPVKAGIIIQETKIVWGNTTSSERSKTQIQALVPFFPVY